MKILRNISLASKNTFQIPVIAKEFIILDNCEDIYRNYNKIGDKLRNAFVLGGGSNILFVGNQNIPIVSLGFKGQKLIKHLRNCVLVEVLAGTLWDDFVEWAVQRKLYGIENLSFIPGTIGGAVVQNIGAYGAEISDFIENITVLDTQTGEIKIFPKGESGFGYRTSLFKQEGGRFMVLKVSIRLYKTPKFNLSHKDLQAFRNDNQLTLEKIRKHIYTVRNRKLPDWKHEPNAGSVFVNPIVNKNKLKELQQSFLDIPYYEVSEGKELFREDDKNNNLYYKIPAAWLIDKAGLKGFKLGGAKVSEKHALVIVNEQDKTGNDIYALIKHVQNTILEKFGINLKPEIRILVNGRLVN